MTALLGKNSGGRPILVLAAFEPELTALRRGLLRGGISDSAVCCAAAGIGAIDAAAGAAVAIAANAPRMVLFLGTAGSYQAQIPVGHVVVGRRIQLVSTAAVRRDGYLPAPMSVRAEADVSLRKALAHSGDATLVSVGGVATPLAITTSATLAARIATATGAVAENLEAFAIARAATMAGLPFAVVLGISNRVGPGAHAEWLRHQDAASAAAARVLETFLLARAGHSPRPTARAGSVRAPTRSPGARSPRSRRER